MKTITHTHWSKYMEIKNCILPIDPLLRRIQSGVRIQKCYSPSSPPLLDRTENGFDDPKPFSLLSRSCRDSPTWPDTALSELTFDGMARLLFHVTSLFSLKTFCEKRQDVFKKSTSGFTHSLTHPRGKSYPPSRRYLVLQDSSRIGAAQPGPRPKRPKRPKRRRSRLLNHLSRRPSVLSSCRLGETGCLDRNGSWSK